MHTFEDFVEASDRAGLTSRKKSDDEYVIRCPNPAHEDKNPSVSLSRGDDDRALLHCHSRQCSFESMLEGLGLSKSVKVDGFEPSKAHVKKSQTFNPIYEREMILTVYGSDWDALDVDKLNKFRRRAFGLECSCYREAMYARWAQGWALIEIKDRVEHGNFERWLQDNKVQVSHANRCMQLARIPLPKLEGYTSASAALNANRSKRPKASTDKGRLIENLRAEDDRKGEVIRNLQEEITTIDDRTTGLRMENQELQAELHEARTESKNVPVLYIVGKHVYKQLSKGGAPFHFVRG